jgi:hypothetical protein
MLNLRTSLSSKYVVQVLRALERKDKDDIGITEGRKGVLPYCLYKVMKRWMN